MFSKGFVSFENPISIHTSGKKTARLVRDVSSYLFSLFSLNENDFDLVYHSGATEFTCTFFKGLSLQAQFNNQNFSLIHLLTDHACITSQRDFLKSMNQNIYSVQTNQNGNFPSDKLCSLAPKIKSQSGLKLFNFTWVNNETGIVYDLKKAIQIKETLNCLVHVDATQAVGKIKNWTKLASEIDAYTFSGHKFGALKGVGFSFIKKNIKLANLISGGGQQKYRSGTANTYGICSLKLALEEVCQNSIDYSDIKNSFEKEVIQLGCDKITIIGQSSDRNSNTTCLLFDKLNVQDVFMQLDLAGFDVSLGSACSAGLANPSPVIGAMNYTQDQANNILRVSLPFKKVDFDLAQSLKKFLQIISSMS